MKYSLRHILWVLLLLLSSTVCATPDQATDSYIQAVTAAVNEAVLRPNVEMNPRETGVVTVLFDRTDNTITNLKVEKSSRVRAFDNAALEAVKSAKYPTVPPKLQHKTVHISVVVRIPEALPR